MTTPRTIMNPSARGGDDAALLIDLDSTDGNAFSVVGTVGAAMLDEGYSASQIAYMRRVAFESESYEALLAIVAQFVNVAFIRHGAPFDPMEH